MTPNPPDRATLGEFARPIATKPRDPVQINFADSSCPCCKAYRRSAEGAILLGW